MNIKHYKSFLAIVGLGLLVSLAVAHYFLKPSCIRYKSGNVVIDVYYPRDFLVDNHDVPYPSLYLKSEESGRRFSEARTLGKMRSIDILLENSKVEPGPRYNLATFKDFEAIFAEGESYRSIRRHYIFPFGNKTVNITYEISEETKEEIENIINAMEFKTSEKEVYIPEITSCSS